MFQAQHSHIKRREGRSVYVRIPAYAAAAGSLAAESPKVTVREGGDEGIEGPIIMHSALLDPGREKGEYCSTEDMHIQI